MTGLLLFAHGSSKLFGFPASEYSGRDLMSMTGFTGAVEFVGGVLFFLGLFTRITTFILSGFMAIAYFMVHAPRNFHPVNNEGELAILYCFVFLYFAAAASGQTWLTAFQSARQRLRIRQT